MELKKGNAAMFALHIGVIVDDGQTSINTGRGYYSGEEDEFYDITEGRLKWHSLIKELHDEYEKLGYNDVNEGHEFYRVYNECMRNPNNKKLCRDQIRTLGDLLKRIYARRIDYLLKPDKL